MSKKLYDAGIRWVSQSLYGCPIPQIATCNDCPYSGESHCCTAINKDLLSIAEKHDILKEIEEL